jgi:mRNA-degrading endonuclease toxin of MazEF toxin-antitoxin module
MGASLHGSVPRDLGTGRRACWNRYSVTRAVGLLRGQVVVADLPTIGRKLGLVVSNNARNQAFRDVLVARLTTTAPKAPRAAAIPLNQRRDGFTGWVICDDIAAVTTATVSSIPAALPPSTMRLVDRGLRAALGLA